MCGSNETWTRNGDSPLRSSRSPTSASRRHAVASSNSAWGELIARWTSTAPCGQSSRSARAIRECGWNSDGFTETPAVEDLIKKAKAVRADGLDLSASKSPDKAYADAIKSAGPKLYVWTVNDLGVARRMIDLGVDGITTDQPGWLRENLKK